MNFYQKIKQLEKFKNFDEAYELATQNTKKAFCSNDERLWIDKEITIGTLLQWECDAEQRNEKAEQYFIDQLENQLNLWN